MGELVRCDKCSAAGERGFRTPCPPSWWYLKSVDEGGLGDYYVFACSPACRDSLWQPGPGPVIPGTEQVTAILRGQAPWGQVPCGHANEVPLVCSCHPECYCKGRTCR